MNSDTKKKKTYELCKSLWERLYPDVKKPETYFRGWYAEAVKTGEPVLDAGCGAGGSINHNSSGIISVGLDTDVEALKRNTNVLYKVVGLIDSLPFRDGTFGTITAQYAIEHLAAPDVCFKEIARTASTGASFIFMTTNASSYGGVIIRLIPHRIQFLLKRHFLKMPENEIYPVYLRCNTLAKLKRTLSDSGFGNSEFIFVGGPFYFSFSYILFRIAVLLEQMTDGGLRHLKFYIIGRSKKL